MPRTSLFFIPASLSLYSHRLRDRVRRLIKKSEPRLTFRTTVPLIKEEPGRWLSRLALCSVCGLGMALLSCAATDKRAATKSNIQEGLQQALIEHPQCLPLAFPVITSDPLPPGEPGDQLKILIAAGLVEKPHPVPIEREKNPAAWRRPQLEFRLTPLGQKYKGTITPLLGNPETALCYAHAQVLDVKQFTEPAPFFGQIVTSVTYEYRLVDFAPWALQPAITQAFHLDKDLQLRTHTETGQAALAQTSEGWRAAH